ncbi:MAG: hypothetical protein ACYCXW_12295 [Solirubrobacteraceae bacterium]
MPRPAPSSGRLLPSAQALRIVDLVMALWVAVWIGLGVWIGIDVHHLTRLNDTVAADGAAVQQIGHTLSTLSGIPFVGGTIGRTGHQLQSAGARSVAGATRSASAIRQLSVLLAIGVALLPSVPVFGFYLPLRLARVRERRAVRRALRSGARAPQLRTFLAQRAVATLDYDQLQATADGADESGREQRLAAAELRRLGLDPRALTTHGDGGVT